MSGKPDMLRSGGTLPMVCNQCNSVKDVLTGQENLSERKCHKCSSNQFSLWDYKKKACPKCNHAPMGELEDYRIVD